MNRGQQRRILILILGFKGLINKILLIGILQNDFITFLSFLPKLKPGVPFSTTSVEIPLGPDEMNEVQRRKLLILI